MKKVGIIPNISKDANLSFTKKMINHIISIGGEPLLTLEIAERLKMTQLGLKEDAFFKTVDFITVLGGDGTLLGVARDSAIYNKPLVGVNIGNLGYLTDVEKKDSFEALVKIFKGEYKLEKRMMLQATISNEIKEEGIQLALNDICVNRYIFNKMISINLYINDEFIDLYKCDGLIISSPTGSTAYNLAAGGPVLIPNSEMIAITPICPHMIYSRPAVISGEDVIKIEMANVETNDAVISYDGKTAITLNPAVTITIKKSEYYTTLIKTNGLGFYDVLRRKMISTN
jgi:NAD+ kinase